MRHLLEGMTAEQAAVAAGSVMSAATIVGASAIKDGVDPTTGWAGGIIVAGATVFLFMDRRAQKERREEAENHRRRDEEDALRIQRLEAQIDAERAAHAETARLLNDRIQQILKDHD